MSPCSQKSIPVLAALLVLGSMGMSARAQDEAGVCPCFSPEEIEALFLKSTNLAAGGGGGTCQAEDYSVEFSAALVVWDENFATVAEASVTWSDFDPATCLLLDTTATPPVERNTSWPHPAPEATARACFDVISGAIADLDTDGRCITYP